MEFPHTFGFQIVNTPPCLQNSIIVNPPSPSEILKAVRGMVWIFSGIAHYSDKDLLKKVFVLSVLKRHFELSVFLSKELWQLEINL